MSHQTEVVEKTEVEIDHPKMHRVILHNDNKTAMDFVVAVLISVFSHSMAEAYNKMMEVHTKGRAVAGVYSFEIAETKADETMLLAGQAGYPLQATTEPDE